MDTFLTLVIALGGTYWALYGNANRKMREVHGDPEIYEDFGRLDLLLADLGREALNP